MGTASAAVVVVACVSGTCFVAAVRRSAWRACSFWDEIKSGKKKEQKDKEKRK